MSQTIYVLMLAGERLGHCYSFMSALRWRNTCIEDGYDPRDVYITKGRLPLRVPVYGPLEKA
jgi:hypothetical protein